MRYSARELVTLIVVFLTIGIGRPKQALVGQWIIFVCDLPLGSQAIYKVRPDGSEVGLVFESYSHRMHSSGYVVSPDGTALVFIDNYQLMAVSLTSGSVRQLLRSPSGMGFDSDFVYDQGIDEFVVDTSKSLSDDVSGSHYLFNSIKLPTLNMALSDLESMSLGSLAGAMLTGTTRDTILQVNLDTYDVDQYSIIPDDYDGLRLGRTQTSPNGEFTLFEIEQRRQSPEFVAPRTIVPASDFSPTFRYDLYRMDSSTGEINHIAPGIQSRALISPDGERIAYAQYNDEDKEYHLIVSRPDGGDPTVVLRHPCIRSLGSWSLTPRPQRAGQQFTQPAIPLIQPPAPPPPAS